MYVIILVYIFINWNDQFVWHFFFLKKKTKRNDNTSSDVNELVKYLTNAREFKVLVSSETVAVKPIERLIIKLIKLSPCNFDILFLIHRLIIKQLHPKILLACLEEIVTFNSIFNGLSSSCYIFLFLYLKWDHT